MLTTYRRDAARRIADCTMAREGLLDKRWSNAYDLKGTGAYIQAAWKILRIDQEGEAS